MVSVAHEDLAGLAGRDLGHTEWLMIDQDRVDAFADAVADHQWIHVDPVRAASGPYGGTIAHGYLTLALVNPLWDQLLTVRGARAGDSFIDKVRFLSPVRVGSRVRLAGAISSVDETHDGVQLGINARVEIDGGERAALVLTGRRELHTVALAG